MKGMVRRIGAAMARDLLIQYRARYVLAAVLALAAWAAALRRFPEASTYVIAPAFLFLNTFVLVFSIGLRQAEGERRQGILSALDLTPLRPQEYLAARFGSLGLIAALQNALIALAAGKPVSSWLSLSAAVGGEAAILSLAAFLITAFAPPGKALLPRFLAAFLLLVPPLLPYLGFASGPWLLAHPLQGSSILFQGAFLPLPGRMFAGAIAVSGVWAGILLAACYKAYSRIRKDARPGPGGLPDP